MSLVCERSSDADGAMSWTFWFAFFFFFDLFMWARDWVSIVPSIVASSPILLCFVSYGISWTLDLSLYSNFVLVHCTSSTLLDSYCGKFYLDVHVANLCHDIILTSWFIFLYLTLRGIPSRAKRSATVARHQETAITKEICLSYTVVSVDASETI